VLSHRVEKTIKAEPERIWSILTDGSHYPDWNPSVDRLEGSVAPGEKIKLYVKINPGKAFPVKVRRFEPPHLMTWEGGMPLGLFKGVRTFTLTPDSNGATVFRMEEVFSGPLSGLIGKSIPDMTEPFEQFGRGLKAAAEA
jgi:hypothetical protein